MPRPSVLVVDPETSRRREIASGLTGFGYEVIPAIGPEEGRRFARGLGLGVVVAPVQLARGADGTLAERFEAPDSKAEHTLLLLGQTEEEARDLPEDVLFLKADGTSPAELVRRIHLVLLGREMGIEPAMDLESLVGDFALVPFLELVRAANRAHLSGRIASADGEVALADGEVIAASAGRARGVKAFLRLSHLDAGPFWVRPGLPVEVEREIQQDLTPLIFLALEDHVRDAPDPRARARAQLGPSFFESRFTPRQQELLAALPSCATVAGLLDALPATDGEILRDLRDLRALGVVALEEPDDRVQVVTDSTCDLPPEVARAHGIEVVPVLVLFGDRVYHDGIDLKAKEFYELLENGPVHPHTHPAPKADFLTVYSSLVPRKDVISVHLSEKLSRTVVHARQAADEGLAITMEDDSGQRYVDVIAKIGPRIVTGSVPVNKINGEVGRVSLRVVDSRSASLGLGLLALFAARMARRGLALDAIVDRLEGMRERMHVLFVVDTLEYLARGGRIGKARALVGGLLGIKPILGVVNGEIVAVDKVRGGRAAHPKLIERFRERIDPNRPVVATVAHAKAPVWADRLRGLLEKTFQVEEILMAEMGPVVAANAGPGTVGAAVFQPSEEEWGWIEPLESA